MNMLVDGISQRRLRTLSGIVVLGAAVITCRLFQKSVLENPQYRAQAMKQYVARQEIPAQRGKIFAKEEYDDSFPVGTNVQYFQVLVVPKEVSDPKKTAKLLAGPLGITEADIFKKINNKKVYIPPLKKHVEKKLADKIAQMQLSGVFLTVEPGRFYTEGPLAGQIIGFVDAEGKGRYGVEGFYNKELLGNEGIRVATRDSLGRRIKTIGEEVAKKDGVDIYLTIERNTQAKAEEVIAKAVKDFEADKGSLVVVDVKTGGVVAMANVPSYDPNNYRQVAKDTPDLFRNPVVSEPWEPGSVIKPLVMAAALDQGLVTPETEEVFPAFVEVQGFKIWTALKRPYGKETMTQVLEKSDNVAMVWVANKLGNENEYRYLKAFGIGEKTGIDLQGEAMGSLLNLKRWRDINRATISFGQGMSSTPLQIAMAYTAVANKGVLIKPHVVESLKQGSDENKIGRTEVRRVLSDDTAKKLTEMLIAVVENHAKKAGAPGYWVAGKTGTAQIPNPKGGYFEDKHIGSFAGFFPADNPRFAMVVKVDNPKNTQWADSSAAPTFGEMAQWLLSYYRISPVR